MQKELIAKNPLLKLSLEFSILILKLSNSLNDLKKYTISNQIVRSGTSIGANAMVAQNAESKADFIHKIKIAAKEADETQYWLNLCELSKGYPDINILTNKLIKLQKILNSILGTSRRKSPLSYFLSLFIF